MSTSCQAIRGEAAVREWDVDQILVAFQSGISLVLPIQNLLMSPVNFSAADNAMQIHVVHTCRSYQ